MITFKQFLREKSMNPTSFAAAIKKFGDDALLGFEAEVWVNEDSDFVDEQEASYIHVDDLKTVDDFDNYFYLSRYDKTRIDNEFETWQSEAEDGDKDWATYFDDRFGDSLSFIRAYRLKPTYGFRPNDSDYVYTEKPPDDEPDWHTVAEKVARRLENYLEGDKVYVGNGDIDEWQVVKDSSISGDGAGVGVEIISPPTKVSKALIDLRAVFKFIDKSNIITNHSTGLHINLSIPGLADKLDPLKLVLFMGEKHVLREFDRLGNDFAKTHARDITDSINDQGRPPKGSDIVKLARSVLKDTKYKTVNLSKLSSGYLEFRVAGNADYHLEYDKVMNTIGRFISALELACDPDAERKLYLKKVAKILNVGLEQRAPKLESFRNLVNTTYKLFPAAHKLMASIDAVLAGNKTIDVAETMASIMADVGEYTDEKNIEISPKVKAEFKHLISKLGKARDDSELLKKIINTEHASPSGFNAFMKAFGVK